MPSELERLFYEQVDEGIATGWGPGYFGPVYRELLFAKPPALAFIPPFLPKTKGGKEGRAWRFDLALPAQMVAVEIEGGIYTKGKHATVGGIKADMEKATAATLLGWTVFRFHGDQIRSGGAARVLLGYLSLLESRDVYGIIPTLPPWYLDLDERLSNEHYTPNEAAGDWIANRWAGPA